MVHGTDNRFNVISYVKGKCEFGAVYGTYTGVYDTYTVY